MSLRKSPTLTLALLAANRRNAQKSTGPRTERGKNWSRVNPLRTGRRSRQFSRFVDAVLAAMPGEVRNTAEAMVPPHLACHPLYVNFLDGILETDRQMAAEHAESRRRRELAMKTTFQAGMSLKTNGTANQSAMRSPASVVTARQAESTFQPGTSLKTNAAAHCGVTQAPVSAVTMGKPQGLKGSPEARVATFQAGMSLKTESGIAQSVRSLALGAGKPAMPSQSAVSREPNGKTTFQAGRSLKTDEFSEYNIARVTEMARRIGMPKAFFDWVDREIRPKSNTPTRNVIEKKEGA